MMPKNVDYLDGKIIAFDIETGEGKIRANEPDDNGDDRVHFNVSNLRNFGLLQGISDEQIAATVGSRNFITLKNIPVAFHEAEGEWEVPILSTPTTSGRPAAIREERQTVAAAKRRSISDPSADQPDLADDAYWPGAQQAMDKASINRRPAIKRRDRDPNGNDGPN